MICKIKSKMKFIPILLIIILVLSRTINSYQIDEQSDSLVDFKKDIIEPSDLLPAGIDLNKFVFIEKNLDHKDNQYNNFFLNDLVHKRSTPSNDNIFKKPTPLPLSSSNDNQQLPNLILENFIVNDLTKNQKLNSNNFKNQIFSNYLPDSDPLELINNFKQLMPNVDFNKLDHDSSNQQMNHKIEPNNHENLDKIKQLDSRINLYDVLDQINVLMGSNLGRNRIRQRGIIRKNPGILTAIDKGLKLSFSECKFQFKDNNWNCPINQKSKGKEMYGKILDKACPETAYLTSVISAGISYSMIKACSDGLISTCSCDYRSNKNYISDQPGESLFNSDQYSLLNSNSINSNKLGLKLGINGIGGNAIQLNDNVNQEYTSDFRWSGCSDNFKFAFKMSKQLLDYHLKKSPSTQDKILIHNYEAGRKAVKESMYLVCKCHGMSGLCTMRTCWYRLSSFRKTGNHLKQRYNTAVQVVSGNDGETLTPKEDSIVAPTSLDLFYSDPSPDFCKTNLEEGSLGTHGRECNIKTSGKLNSCDQLCCGRGYRKKMKIVKYSCNCQFKWCCDIRCDTCKKSILVYECV